MRTELFSDGRKRFWSSMSRSSTGLSGEGDTSWTTSRRTLGPTTVSEPNQGLGLDLCLILTRALSEGDYPPTVTYLGTSRRTGVRRRSWYGAISSRCSFLRTFGFGIEVVLTGYGSRAITSYGMRIITFRLCPSLGVVAPRSETSWSH